MNTIVKSIMDDFMEELIKFEGGKLKTLEIARTTLDVADRLYQEEILSLVRDLKPEYLEAKELLQSYIDTLGNIGANRAALSATCLMRSTHSIDEWLEAI